MVRLGWLFPSRPAAEGGRAGARTGPERKFGNIASSSANTFLAEVEGGLSAFSAKPVFIAWAMQDIAFTPDPLEQLWLKTFHHVKVLKLEYAGHYLQEDAH